MPYLVVQPVLTVRQAPAVYIRSTTGRANRVETRPVAAKDSPAIGAVGETRSEVLARAGWAGVASVSPAAVTTTAEAEASQERVRFMAGKVKGPVTDVTRKRKKRPVARPATRAPGRSAGYPEAGSSGAVRTPQPVPARRPHREIGEGRQMVKEQALARSRRALRRAAGKVRGTETGGPSPAPSRTRGHRRRAAAARLPALRRRLVRRGRRLQHRPGACRPPLPPARRPPGALAAPAVRPRAGRAPGPPRPSATPTPCVAYLEQRLFDVSPHPLFEVGRATCASTRRRPSTSSGPLGHYVEHGAAAGLRAQPVVHPAPRRAPRPGRLGRRPLARVGRPPPADAARAGRLGR